MQTDSRYVNRDYDTLGKARLFLKADSNDLIELAMLQEARLSMSVEMVRQEETHQEELVTIRSRPRARSLSLSLKFAERLSPDLYQMLTGAAPTIQPATNELVKEILRFDGLRPRFLSRPYGIIDAVTPPTGFVAALFGSGSTITPGVHYLFIEAVFNGGARSAALPSNPTSVTITAGQEKIALEWAHGQVGGEDVVPDYYKIYHSTDAVIDVADTLWISVPGSATSVIISANPGAETWPGAAGGVSELMELDSEAVKVPNTDYVFDATKGLIQSLGSEAAPQLTRNLAHRFSYYILRPAQVFFNIGELANKQVYRKLILQQVTDLEGQEKNVRWEFENVNVVGEGIDELISTASYDDGIDVTMTPEYDVVTQRFGRKYIDGRIVAGWDPAF